MRGDARLRAVEHRPQTRQLRAQRIERGNGALMRALNEGVDFFWAKRGGQPTPDVQWVHAQRKAVGA